MTITYYPKISVITFNHEGKTYGARGNIADRIFRTCMEKGQTVMIAADPIKTNTNPSLNQGNQ